MLFLQHGHVGFMLSCYDAELSYDRRTDTFQARYVQYAAYFKVEYPSRFSSFYLSFSVVDITNASIR